MDDQAAALAAQLVGKAYIEQGRQALKRREGLAKALLSQRKLPAEG
jgi:hypothetical protein